MPAKKPFALTPARLAANRANAVKSTGPRTERGRQRASLNLRPGGARLLGLAEARTLNQEPKAAEELYRRLIAPFEPAPAVLALHFQDLARLQLELRAWEEIRDSQLDHRAQQNSLAVRARERDMDRGLMASVTEVADGGLHRQADSPAKFKAQMEALAVLKDHLLRREFGGLKTPLERLYGARLDPGYERAQIICYDCRRLMDPKPGGSPGEDEIEGLIGLVEREARDALENCELELDRLTETGSASRARLAATREDHWMNVQGDRLRRAIDRKQWVITGLIQALGLTPKLSEEPGGNARDAGLPSGAPSPAELRPATLAAPAPTPGAGAPSAPPAAGKDEGAPPIAAKPRSCLE